MPVESIDNIAQPLYELKEKIKNDPEKVKVVEDFLKNPGTVDRRTTEHKKILRLAHPDHGGNDAHVVAVTAYANLGNGVELNEEQQAVKKRIATLEAEALEAATPKLKTEQPSKTLPAAATTTPRTQASPAQTTSSNLEEGLRRATAAAAKAAQTFTNSSDAYYHPTPQFEQAQKTAPATTINHSPTNTNNTNKLQPLVLSPNSNIDELFLLGLVEICKKNGCRSITIEMPLPENDTDFTNVAKTITKALELLQGKGLQITISEPLLTALRETDNHACKALIKQYDNEQQPRTPSHRH